MLHEPKTVLRRKLITWNVYIGKEEWYQTNSQRLHLKEFNKQEHIWSKLNRKKNHKVKLKAMKMKDINEVSEKSCFLEKKNQ